jgi:hypothetical protein
MKAFATLFAAIDGTTSTNAKVEGPNDWTALARNSFEVNYFFVAQCQSFSLTVCRDIVNLCDGFRSMMDRKNFLIKFIVQHLKHPVMFNVDT